MKKLVDAMCHVGVPNMVKPVVMDIAIKDEYLCFNTKGIFGKELAKISISEIVAVEASSQDDLQLGNGSTFGRAAGAAFGADIVANAVGVVGKTFVPTAAVIGAISAIGAKNKNKKNWFIQIGFNDFGVPGVILIEPAVKSSVKKKQKIAHAFSNNLTNIMRDHRQIYLEANKQKELPVSPRAIESGSEINKRVDHCDAPEDKHVGKCKESSSYDNASDAPLWQILLTLTVMAIVAISILWFAFIFISGLISGIWESLVG